MKVFILDQGWRGGFVILANSAEEAFEKLPEGEKKNGNYTVRDLIELIPTEEEVYQFLGDQ